MLLSNNNDKGQTMANKQKEEREQNNRDKYGTDGLPPETADLTTDDLLRQIESLRGDLKKAGVQDKIEEYFVEADGTHNFEKKPNGAWKTGYHPNTQATKWTEDNRPTGGRPKGSKNKKTLRQEAMDKGQYTPAEFLLSVVNDEAASMGQRISAAKEAAKFFDPSLASVEVHTDDDHEAPFNIFLGDMKSEKKEDK
jgi:hypothetical protein